MVVQAIVDTDNEMVNSPKHYLRGNHEVIEVLEVWNLPFHLSCAVKYLARCGFKNSEKEEMEKCLWYLKRWQFVLASKGYDTKFIVPMVYLTNFQIENGFGVDDVLIDWNINCSELGDILISIYNGELQKAINQLESYIKSIK